MQQNGGPRILEHRAVFFTKNNAPAERQDAPVSLKGRAERFCLQAAKFLLARFAKDAGNGAPRYGLNVSIGIDVLLTQTLGELLCHDSFSGAAIPDKKEFSRLA